MFLPLIHVYLAIATIFTQSPPPLLLPPLPFPFSLILFPPLTQAASNTKNLDVGANVFIGNLDPEIDEKLLYDTFSAFGVILQTPKVGSTSAHTLYAS